jgi:hypothetical protein
VTQRVTDGLTSFALYYYYMSLRHTIVSISLVVIIILSPTDWLIVVIISTALSLRLTGINHGGIRVWRRVIGLCAGVDCTVWQIVWLAQSCGAVVW